MNLEKDVNNFVIHYTVTVLQVRQSWLKLPRVTNRSIGNTTRCVASIYFSVNIYLINNGLQTPLNCQHVYIMKLAHIISPTTIFSTTLICSIYILYNPIM